MRHPWSWARFANAWVNKEPLTSLDFVGEKYSLILDSRWTQVNKKNIQLVFWYDNEMGYSSKIVDIIDKILEK